jgi:hypothetical protein
MSDRSSSPTPATSPRLECTAEIPENTSFSMTKIIPILQKRPLPLVAKVESNRMDSQQTAHHREQIHING